MNNRTHINAAFQANAATEHDLLVDEMAVRLLMLTRKTMAAELRTEEIKLGSDVITLRQLKYTMEKVIDRIHWHHENSNIDEDIVLLKKL